MLIFKAPQITPIVNHMQLLKLIKLFTDSNRTWEWPLWNTKVGERLCKSSIIFECRLFFGACTTTLANLTCETPAFSSLKSQKLWTQFIFLRKFPQPVVSLFL